MDTMVRVLVAVALFFTVFFLLGLLAERVPEMPQEEDSLEDWLAEQGGEVTCPDTLEGVL